MIQDGRFYDTRLKIVGYRMEVSMIKDGKFYDTVW